MIITGVLALAHVYVGFSFYMASGWAGAPWIVGGSFGLILLMPLLRFKGEEWRVRHPSVGPLLRVVGVISMLAIGVFGMVFFFTGVRDLLLFAASFWLSPSAHEWASDTSLRFELGLIVFVFIVGVYQALMGPGVKKVEIPLADLPEAFRGFRIVQISDLHIGPTIRASYVRNVVRAVNALNPDMVAMTGDITDGPPEELKEVAQLLAEMRSTYGRFFVTGNHEYYHEALRWMELHRASGTHVLLNENVRIQKEGAELAILGVPDVSAHQFVPEHVSSPAAAAKGVPEKVIKILLAHQPVIYKTAHAAGVHLQLSGHTHSGQFFPFNLVIGFFHDFYRGLGQFQGMWIYVNPGTGYWGPPLRAAVASEITLLTLVRAT